jgi:hypothetical protein
MADVVLWLVISRLQHGSPSKEGLSIFQRRKIVERLKFPAVNVLAAVLGSGRNGP